MRWWPWVSKEVVEAIEKVSADRLREIEWLKGRLEEADGDRRHLADQLARIGRRRSGLPEAPIPRREREPGDEMPRELEEYFKSIHPREMGQALRTNAMRRRARGDTWAEIAGDNLPRDDDFNHTPDMGGEEEYDGEDS